MIRDAEAHAEEDARRREEAEIRNSADTLVYQTEKLLNEHGDKITDEERSEVEDKMGTLKTALEGNDLEAIKGATEALMTASQQFSQRLYENATVNPDGEASADDAATGGDDDIVDAEIVED